MVCFLYFSRQRSDRTSSYSGQEKAIQCYRCVVPPLDYHTRWSFSSTREHGTTPEESAQRPRDTSKVQFGIIPKPADHLIVVCAENITFSFSFTSVQQVTRTQCAIFFLHQYQSAPSALSTSNCGVSSSYKETQINF